MHHAAFRGDIDFVVFLLQGFLNRATLVCPDAAALEAAARIAVEKAFGTPDALVVEVEDHYFAGPMGAEGYRHIQLLVRLRGEWSGSSS